MAAVDDIVEYVPMCDKEMQNKQNTKKGQTLIIELVERYVKIIAKAENGMIEIANNERVA